MELFRLIFAILIFPIVVNAQHYEWEVLVHGLHPVHLQLEKNKTWVTGKLISSTDTFELEGSWNNDKIELLEFHNGLWTANLKLQFDGNHIQGYWASRMTEEHLHIESVATGNNQSFYYKWLNEDERVQNIHLSPTSGLDWFGHAIQAEENQLQYFYVNTHSTDQILGLQDTFIEKEIIALVEMKKSIPGDQQINAWPSTMHIRENYNSLVEVIMPLTGAKTVKDKLEQWKKAFLQNVKTQYYDLQIKNDDFDLDKLRWEWKAHAYVEVYARTDRCWSFALHSKDLKGHSEVEVFHYDPEKKKEIFLHSELRKWDKLQEVIGVEGEDWDELIFHKDGLVTISAFDGQNGIERKFYADEDMRRYFRFFSPLKRIK